MLQETYALVRRNRAVFAALVFAFCVPAFLDDFLHSKAGSHGGQLIVLFVAFRSIQQMVLAGGDAKAVKFAADFSYVWKHLALFLGVTALAVMPLAIGGKNVVDLLLLLLIALVGYPLALAILGTWPMGTLGPIKVSFADALRCGRSRYGKSFVRIFMAFAVQIAVGVAIGFLVAEPTLSSKGHFTALGVVTEIIVQATAVLTVAYVAVIITHDYMDFFRPNDPPRGRSTLLPSRRF